jgi:DNA-binding MarR family transcriptional regulator
MPDRKSAAALTDHLGYWLRMVSNHVSYAFARKLDGQGVTVAEWVLLRELYDVAALPPSRLAERLGMTRGAISKLADRMIEKDLIARTDSPDDRRAHSLSLTARGARLVPELARLADENDAEFFQDLTAQERLQIRTTLAKIVEKRALKELPLA